MRYRYDYGDGDDDDDNNDDYDVGNFNDRSTRVEQNWDIDDYHDDDEDIVNERDRRNDDDKYFLVKVTLYLTHQMVSQIPLR